MKRIFCSSIIFMSLSLPIRAQLSENFNDGDFTNNPIWTGNTADFIINSSLQLQSNNTVANSNYFLVTPNALANSVQWEMNIQIAFNPSSANYIDVYLIASANDLMATTTTGYFVRIGNTDDEISLYRKDANGLSNKIIDGSNGILNSSNNIMKIKVIRDSTNQWMLSRDLTGSGNFYTSEGSITDATYKVTAFFGFLIKQSTSSFFQKHFFDNIEIKKYVPDINPPSIQSATTISSVAIDVLFDEPVEINSSQSVLNYFVNNSIGNPMSAKVDVLNASLVHLTFSNTFTNAVAYTLLINGIKDLAGNVLNNGIVNFFFHTVQQYDVVIDEIMADPTPQVGLPNNEWIELRNTSSFNINLQGWKLADQTGQSGAMPNFILKPDSFVIVCSGTAANLLAPFGIVINVTGFPSLDNDGDLLSLFSSTGKTIHAVNYTSSWYKNELKKNGGWSLEMIDPRNPCTGIENWKASIDIKGGSPGKKNSVDTVNNDATPPKLIRAFSTNNTEITLLFDEPLDSLKASEINNYKINNGLSIKSAKPVAPLFNKVNIELNSAITASNINTITVNNITDCKGNIIGLKNIARFGLSGFADSLDIVINEILFNPKPMGVDYIELYNRSKKIIDLKNLYIANRNSSNVISSIQQASPESVQFFPGDFIVLSADPAAVKNQYLTTNPEAFITVSNMPSFPDDKGDVIILSNQGNVIDEVKYSDKWHFSLISNTEGVSLERIDFDEASVQNNFHSAATSVGYGTPGYKNSQYRLNADAVGTISVSPDIFSPDNDGTDDFAMITYNFSAAGYVANIKIFDANGRVVRYLQRNALSGITGTYRWDGLDDKNNKLPQGIYIIYTEIFNTVGKKQQFKNVIVLARRY